MRLALSRVIPAVPNDGALLGQCTAGTAQIDSEPIAVAQDLRRVASGAGGVRRPVVQAPVSLRKASRMRLNSLGRSK